MATITILFLSPARHYCVARSYSGPGAAGNQWVSPTQSTLLLIILPIIVLLVGYLAFSLPLARQWAVVGHVTTVVSSDWSPPPPHPYCQDHSPDCSLITRSHFLLTRDREQNVDLIPPGYPSLHCGEEAGLCSDQWAGPASASQPISTGTQ